MGNKSIPITDEMIKHAERMAEQGLYMDQIANALGMGMSTLYEKQNKFPELQDAIKRGQGKGLKNVSNVIYEKAIKGDSSCAMFYLKTRGGWRENNFIVLDDRKKSEEQTRDKIANALETQNS